MDTLSLSDIPYPAKEKIENAITGYEQEIRNLKELINVYSSLCTITDLSVLMESILYTFMCRFQVLGAGLFILDAITADVFKLNSNFTGMELNKKLTYSIPAESPIIKTLQQERRVFTLQELQCSLPDGTDISVLSSLHPTLIVPLVFKTHLNGILLLGQKLKRNNNEESREYTTSEKNDIRKIATFCAVSINNVSLMEQASTDLMTHLRNRYYFFTHLNDELELSTSHKLPLAVIMFDIDYFKVVNDTYGHTCGDFVLKEISRLIIEGVRSKDIACRYGGEEIIVMLQNTDLHTAYHVANRIRQKIDAYDFVCKSQHIHVTTSGGIAVYYPDKEPGQISAKELVDKADRQLYTAKTSGRNRIEYKAEVQERQYDTQLYTQTI